MASEKERKKEREREREKEREREREVYCSTERACVPLPPIETDYDFLNKMRVGGGREKERVQPPSHTPMSYCLCLCECRDIEKNTQMTGEGNFAACKLW